MWLNYTRNINKLTKEFFKMKTAIDQWLGYVSGQGELNEVFLAAALELPPLSSLILDRSCQFQCRHCIFQKETSLVGSPDVGAILHVLKQLPNVKVVHEGRQLTRKQLPLLNEVSRAGYPVGIIDSGTFAPLIDSILQSELKFDWMDISVDGPKSVHNLQRNSSRSWDIAIEGIKQARKILVPKGKLTSLMTITSLNSELAYQTGEEVFARGVDEWHLTTMSVRDGLEKMRVSEKQLEKVLIQMMEVSKLQKNIFLRIYNLEDMQLLISVFGNDAFSELLKNAKVTQNALVLDVGFPLFFYPMSLAPNETLVIDTDNWWRLPYCIKYKLDELKRGRSLSGQDITAYNITKISKQTDVAKMHSVAMNQWKKYCGEKLLVKERELFQNLF